jgi:hypothetical protein
MIAVINVQSTKMTSKMKRSKVSNCTHHFIINSENVGHCRYCPEVRDFGRLLQREGVFVLAGRRGAKTSKGVVRRRKKLKEELL